MPERTAADWEAIEREYRAGQLSLREIGRQHDVTEGAIRKRAKRDEWQRDLTEKVKSAVRQRLVRDAGTQEQRARTEGEIVDAAASRAVEVVRTHRRDLTALRERRTKLLGRYDALTTGETIASLDALAQAAGILESVSRVESRLVPLERQAFQVPAVVSGSEVPAGQTVIPDDPMEAARAYLRLVGGSGV